MVTLNEGSTPLIHSPRLSERVGRGRPPQVRGREPDRQLQGPGYDGRGLTGQGRAGPRRSSAHRPATPPRAAPPTRRGPGMRGAVIVPEGKIAIGKLAQALMHGARVIALEGNFDQALEIVREIAEKHPVELVNSVNPYRIEGQKTAAFETCDELGRGARRARHPRRQRGQRHLLVGGLPGVRGFADPLRLPGRGRRAAGRGASDREPRDRGLGDPDRQPGALGGGDERVHRLARVGSPRSPTSRSSRPTTGSPRARASSASRPRPPRSPDCSPTACRSPRAWRSPRASSACSPAMASRTPTARSARPRPSPAARRSWRRSKRPSSTKRERPE